ncbi:hypothetical protein GYA54_03190 [Candidatus Kuenenbacteria bacterium]|nr:hypothetical protein [Candidatus Kuenenbacteria bacterium]HOZ36954.1 hypothetical protein [bacterium]
MKKVIVLVLVITTCLLALSCCPACEGTGRVADGICPTCKKAGVLWKDKKKKDIIECPDCKGTGLTYKTCPACNGTGW